MSGETPKRSSLVDLTYLQLHSILSGHLEGVSLDQITEYLKSRTEQFRNVKEPFGKPTDASRRKVESGSVTLADGVVLQVEDADKEFVFAISSKFQIDEIQALVLMRSFLYNEGLPTTSKSGSLVSAELVEAITPFYHSERLYVSRVLIPLFRAKETTDDSMHEIASDFLPTLLPDGLGFAETVIAEYTRKSQESLPTERKGSPKVASMWAKQNLKEQLVLLELLFWTMWGYVPCNGTLVQKIFEAAYATNLGLAQGNDTLLLDEESSQMQQDCATLWILIVVEVLELERIGQDEFMASNNFEGIYLASPETLKRIHELVTTHGDSQFVCIYLAWAYVLSRLFSTIGEGKDATNTFTPFLESLTSSINHSYSKDRDPLHLQMSKACLEPDVGLFKLLLNLLSTSPLFVTAVAWKTGSSVTDPNAVAFRSVLKGLVMSLVELVPVELIPEFDQFVEVWIALFGRSESPSVVGICAQFWESDWHHGMARRAILEVARSRFPIQVKPLLRLLRALTGFGFLDTDPLSTADHSQDGEGLVEEREICDRYVFHYLHNLLSYSQVIPISACTGAHALYERQQDRYGSSVTSAGFIYTNLQPIKLPGGTILPARSTGRLLSGDGEDHLVVKWEHQHSGWKVILEILTNYVNRRRLGSSGGYPDVSFGPRGDTRPKTLRIEDIGMEVDGNGDEEAVSDCLDLVRSVIQGNPTEAEHLMTSLDAGDPVVSHTMTEGQPPGLIQLTTLILEDSLSRSNGRARTPSLTKLITSAMSVLSALLVLSNYSNRVWLYIRSATVLFGSDRTKGFASVALAAERATGHYTMTLALLHLVQQLYREASSSILPNNPKLQLLKEEVLMRAIHFIHTEIWVEHLGWKYSQLGDRFEIGRRVTSLYEEVLENSPPTLENRPFPNLSQSVTDALLFKATTSTINPLVSSLTSGSHLLQFLYSTRRYGDARRLIFLLESHLRLCRRVLNIKQRTASTSNHCLLEQTLCARIAGGAFSHDQMRSKLDPIDVLASYVKDRSVGSIVPLESIRVLHALCASLSLSQPSATIIGHLSDPESTVASLVHIIQHPYDDLFLRNAIWSFISLAIAKEPALGSLFVTGRFRGPEDVSSIQPKIREKQAIDKSRSHSALDVARDMLSNWSGLWEANPQMLASVFRFLDAVWQHGLEYKNTLKPVHEDTSFWDYIVSILCEEIGPVPDYETSEYSYMDGVRHSNLHESVVIHSYRTAIKSYAVHILGLDVDIHRQLHGTEADTKKPGSILRLMPHMEAQDQLTDLLSEAAPSSYDPQLHDQLVDTLRSEFEGLTLEQLETQEPLTSREYGDEFSFSASLLSSRLRAYQDNSDPDFKDMAAKLILSINLNLSLSHSQTSLAESWEFLLRKVSVYVRGSVAVRPILLSISASISYDIAGEKRSGDMMATIHGTRLSLLLAIIELAWFSSSDKPAEIKSFTELAHNVRGIILNDAQSPSRSFLGTLTTPFHQIILQLIYFCAKHSRSLYARPKALNAEQRLEITLMIEASLILVIDALRVVFIAARSRADIGLDRDMELLVTALEQCTRRDVSPSSTLWLARCQETDIIRASLDLFVHIDLVGLSDVPLLLSRKQPLYAPHILLFHMALASHVTAAEKFAGDGVLAAYSNNFISAATSAGMISVTIPELPGERSPAHIIYCSMLSNIATIINALGRQNHYFDAEACGFVQLYGDQISRALSWTMSDPITMPLIEEMEQVVNLFYSIASNAVKTSAVLEKVLRVFTTHSLLLLQQINYAITHPNHLASVFEAVTHEERLLAEKEHTNTDPLQRSLVIQVIHHLYRLSSNILGTLIAISRADTVLLGAQDDWPVGEALIVPHTKVVLGEPASLGTLLEMGNCTIDMLRELLNRPLGQSVVQFSAVPSTSLDVRQGILTARRNLEALSLYSVTQLAMWLSKPEFDGPRADVMDIEEQQVMDLHKTDMPRERRSRVSISMAERLHRGMTSEMTNDLQSLLNKAKPLFAKSDSAIGTSNVDLTQILLNFLHDHISSS